MPPAENIPDDGTLAYAMRYAAAELIHTGLNAPHDGNIENAAQKFFSLPRQKMQELALVLYTVAKRYYAEHPPSDELAEEWKAIIR